MTSVATAPPGQLDVLGRLTLALLVFDGFLCAILSVLFLPLYLGSTPFPISILVAAVVNLALVIAARSTTGRVGLGALPLVGWALGFLFCMFGGPGGDALVLVSVWTLLLVAGAVIPSLAYLWKVSVANAVARSVPTTAGGVGGRR
ncbi:hypothetical protein BFN03_02590 [Rhodococcus sp. WMMA185]|uniref:hypothetical protein n=1 Tax=Rhodococcus sp. WMMA185 TaxID=679318 RepID=UPI0008791CF5|nr:hypothetical protein [Rhodococcus sp. WMMA185]AOW91958.1 hypothetical protein BFN03_02590 [Rhodococcus sp. WMMA185]